MPNTIEVGVAGVTFEGRQDVLMQLFIMQEAGTPLSGLLEREPGDAYDPNAVKVYIESLGRHHIGYIPKALAARLAAHMDAGEALSVVRARVIRGGDANKVTFGARIHIEMPIKEAV